LNGKHRHPATVHLTRAAALVLALIGTGAMLSLRPSEPAPAGQEPTLASAYPDAKPARVKQFAADGALFTPLYFIDAERYLGTAINPEGEIRLLLTEGGQERELRRISRDLVPDYAGFAVRGERLVWLELSYTTDNRGLTELWTIDTLTAQPRLLTADTGYVTLHDRADDVVIHDDSVSWTASAPVDTPVTEIRTIALTGGKVGVQTRDGSWAFAGYPWLTSMSAAPDGPVLLVNLATAEQIPVTVQPNELVVCNPGWCRAVVIGVTENSTVIEVFRPTDPQQRIRSASGSVASSIVDVAPLGRYELYSRKDGRLTLFDIERSSSVALASNFGQVASRGPVIWWSTGDNETSQWQVLDLRTLEKS
jgi:hypothetical protein